MSIGFITAVLIILLILLLGLGTPIAFSLGFLGVAGILSFLDINNLYQIAEIAADVSTSLFLITAPLFILMAEVVQFSGLGDDIYTAANKWLGWLPGGLAVSSIATCTGLEPLQ